MKFEIKQAIVEFKSLDEYYIIEENGKKPNTVRALTDEEISNADHATHIRIIHEKGVKMFERKLTNVCVIDSMVLIKGVHRPLLELKEENKKLVIFSWEHPPTQTRAFRPMTKEEIKKAVDVGCDIYVGRRDPNTKTILTDQEEYICSGRTDRT